MVLVVIMLAVPLWIGIYSFYNYSLDIDLMLFYYSNPWVPYLSLPISAGIVYAMYRFNHAKIVRMTKGKRIEETSDPQLLQAHNILKEMQLASGVQNIDLWLINDNSLNAFACGNTRKGHVALTRGLLEAMDREELQGVIAHEVGHIRNGDTSLMSAIYGVSSLLLGFSAVGGRVGRLGLLTSASKRDNSGAGSLFALVILVIAGISWLFSWIIRLFIATSTSRQREWLADATAVELTRNPSGLRSALEKISSSDVPPGKKLMSVSHMAINRSKPVQGLWTTKLNTHPPIEERIAQLYKMGSNIAPQVQGTKYTFPESGTTTTPAPTPAPAPLQPVTNALPDIPVLSNVGQGIPLPALAAGAGRGNLPTPLTPVPVPVPVPSGSGQRSLPQPSVTMHSTAESGAVKRPSLPTRPGSLPLPQQPGPSVERSTLKRPTMPQPPQTTQAVSPTLKRPTMPQPPQRTQEASPTLKRPTMPQPPQP